MAYQKQGFADGDILFAHHLEHIEQGIIDHEKNTENPHNVTAQQVGARPDGWVPTAEEVGAATSQDVNDAKTAAVATAQAYTNTQVRKAAHRDLLDNSDFRNPVNQRGQTSWNTHGYTVDRWDLSTVGDFGIKLTDIGIEFAPTSNNLVLLRQVVPAEVRKRIIGKTVTATAKTSDGRIWCSSCAIPEVGVGIDSPQNEIGGLKINIYATPEEDTLAVRLFSGSIATPVTVESVALYEGEYTIENLPEYRPKGYGMELQECRRYYREDKIAEVNHNGLSGMQFLNTPFYEPPMRIIPTYSIRDYGSSMGDLAESTAISNVWGGDNRKILLSYNSTGVASQCVFTLISNADL